MGTLMKKGVISPSLKTIFSDFFEDTNKFFDIDPVKFNWANIPATNIREDKDSFVIELAVPGMAKKDFNIDVDNGFLTITSEKEEATEEKEDNYTRREYNFNSFRRTFTLPEFVKEDEIKAVYEDGILKLTVPKKDEAKLKARKHITVK